MEGPLRVLSRHLLVSTYCEHASLLYNVASISMIRTNLDKSPQEGGKLHLQGSLQLGT